MNLIHPTPEMLTLFNFPGWHASGGLGGHSTDVDIGGRSAGHVDTSYRQNGRSGGGVQDRRTGRTDQLHGVSHTASRNQII